MLDGGVIEIRSILIRSGILLLGPVHAADAAAELHPHLNPVRQRCWQPGTAFGVLVNLESVHSVPG
jgi:hypothetical protein